MCPTQSQLASRLMLAGTGDPPGGYRQPRTMPRRTVINSLRLRYVKRGGGLPALSPDVWGRLGRRRPPGPPCSIALPHPNRAKLRWPQYTHLGPGRTPPKGSPTVWPACLHRRAEPNPLSAAPCIPPHGCSSHGPLCNLGLTQGWRWGVVVRHSPGQPPI